MYGWQGQFHDRLTQPMIRNGRELIKASWDEAMELITSRSRELLSSKGPLSHGFYTSGQLMLEEYYTLSVIGKAGIGTPHMDGNTRLCTATAAASLKESFGADGQPGSYADLDVCDTLFCFGHNVAATQTVLWSRILDRLAGSNPPHLIAVDPRIPDWAEPTHACKSSATPNRARSSSCGSRAPTPLCRCLSSAGSAGSSARTRSS
jgi:ferredoxin-nitrate reductase